MQRRVVLIISSLVACLLVPLAAPASAATVYGTYYNGVGKYEGTYSYVDCGGCNDDGAVKVSNVRNGYMVRVRFYAYVNGSWSRYMDRWLSDDSTGKFFTGYPPKGSKVRINLCTYNSRGEYRGPCTNRYTYNTTY